MIATVVILSFSAFASLRETAAAKGIEEFFTSTRKGAKGGDGRTSISGLSDFASLRENAVTEVFTPGRDEAGGRAIGVNRPYLERLT